MNLIHLRVKLRHGSLIRIIGSQATIKPEIYQYVVDMLWPDNIWHRILVSNLYHNVWDLMTHASAYAYKAENNFHVVYYVKRNREKYGKEEIVST